MKNLDDIFNQIQFSTILTTGRTGSDYLQSCLDNVPGVLTFSDKVFYYNFCDKMADDMFETKESLQILDSFIQNNDKIFKRDDLENKEINLDLRKFKENFIYISKNKKNTRQKFLLTIYLAYHLTINRNIENIKTLVHHSHNIYETKRFLEDFEKSKLLVTIRDPRANLKSGIVNWGKYDEKKKNQEHTYLYIQRIREDLKFAEDQNNQKFFVKLEEADQLDTKKKLSQFLNIDYSKEIHTATYAGKVWKGDKISQFQSKNGEYNKKVLENGWENYFSKNDKIILDLIYADYKLFGYKVQKTNWLNKIKIFLSIPFSLLFDKSFLRFKNILNKNQKIELYFYLKKVIYLYFILFKLK